MVKNTKRLKRRSGKRSRRNTRNIRRPRRSKRNIRRTRRRRSKKVYLSRGGGSCQLAKRPPYPKVGDVIIFEGDGISINRRATKIITRTINIMIYKYLLFYETITREKYRYKS